MAVRQLRVAVYAGVAALLASVLLVVVSAIRQSPGGAGENIEWLLSYLLLLGFPTSLLVAPMRPLLGSLGIAPTLIQAAMVLSVVTNWSILAYLLASLLRLVWRRPEA